MAVTRTLSNEFKLELGKGSINFGDTGAGAFRVVLMNNTFTFDRDTHGTYEDIKADELDTGNGYTKLDKALVADSAWAQDDVNNKGAISWENPTWTADTGSIGPTGAAVVLQYDATDPGGEGAVGDLSLVVGCIDFGEDITVTDGVSFQLQNMGFDLTQAV